MSTLHDRLGDLADDAPIGAHEPDVWDRGRSYGRRRRVRGATVVGALVAALAVVVGLAWQQARPDRLRPAGAPAGLPDRIFPVAPWLPGTDDAGPLGVVAAVFPATRSTWFGSSTEVAAISAETGEYRFLDLPDVVGDEPVSLAPDGRHLAYWVGGRPGLTADPNAPAVGLALYDTVAGEVVERYEVPTEHGLVPDLLTWVDDSRVLATYGQAWAGAGERDVGSSTSQPPVLATIGEESLVPLPNGSVAAFDLADGTTPTDGHVLIGTRRGLRLVDLGGSGRGRGFSVPAGWSGVVVASPGLAHVATVAGNATPGPLAAGSLEPGGVVAVDLPGNRQVHEILGWADATHVVTKQSTGGRQLANERLVVRSTDVTTGAVRDLVALPDTWVDLEVARDLLAVPTVPGAEPPSPLDPRVTAFLVLILLATAGSAYQLWGRRVRT